MDKMTAIMTQKLRNLLPTTVPMIPNLCLQPHGQRQRVMPNITLTNSCKNRRGALGYKLRGVYRKGIIMIVFQKMGGICNASDQTSQHKLDIF